MKTYVITLSQAFPKTHSKSGEPTHFPVLFRKKKIHTIRANYPLWFKRFEQIDNGEACLSVRMWTGKPYRSKQHELARLTKDDGIGIERLDFYHDRDGNILKFVTVGGAYPNMLESYKDETPITKKWLYKNFPICSNYCHFYYDYEDDSSVKICETIGEIRFVEVDNKIDGINYHHECVIKTVGQLRMFLTLCGLDDLVKQLK